MVGAALAAAALALAATAATAQSANTYYASSTGTGDCGAGTPCSFQTAIVAATASGDEILLRDAGPHSISAGPQLINSGVTVAPETTGIRPEITSTDSLGRLYLNPGAKLRDLRVDLPHLHTAPAISLYDARLERVEVWAGAAASSDVTGLVVQASSGVTDSVIWSQGSFGTGVYAAAGTATLTNTTVVTAGAFASALSSDTSSPGAKTLSVNNSILRGGPIALHGDADSPITATFTNSNHASISTETPAHITVSETGQQDGLPTFVNATAGDFRQGAGSTSTIDRGATGGFLGPADLLGGSRVVGSAPDIGADEFDPAPPTAAGGSTTAPGPTGKRAAALAKCKKKSGKARKKCRRRAQRLPV